MVLVNIINTGKILELQLLIQIQMMDILLELLHLIGIKISKNIFQLRKILMKKYITKLMNKFLMKNTLMY